MAGSKLDNPLLPPVEESGANKDGSQYTSHGGKKVTTMQARFIFLKSMVGAGILTFPNAINDVGIPLAIVIFAFLSILITFSCYSLTKTYIFCHQLIIQHMATDRDVPAVRNDDGYCPLDFSASGLEGKGSDHLDIPPACSGPVQGRPRKTCHTLITYGDVAETIAGRTAGNSIRITIIMIHILISCALIASIQETVQSLLGLDEGSKWVIFLSLCLIQGYLFQISSLQDLWQISAFALFVQIMGVVVCSLISIWFGEPNPIPSDTWKIRWDNNAVFQFVGVSIYLMEGIGLVIPTISSMKEPTEGCALITSSMSIYSVLVMIFGVLAYGGGLGGLEINDECALVINCITLNSLKIVVQTSMVVAMVFSVPILAYPGIEMLELLSTDNENGTMATLVCKSTVYTSARECSSHETEALERTNWKLRLFIMVAVVLVGSYVQDLIVVVSLVGSVFMNYAALIMPPMLYFIALEKTNTPISFLECIMICLSLSAGVTLVVAVVSVGISSAIGE